MTAFTIPLPLFPRLIDYYTSLEANDPSSLLARTLSVCRAVRALATGGRHATPLHKTAALDVSSETKRWDVVLLGGAMGSVFSLCQCVISPYLGARELMPSLT